MFPPVPNPLLTTQHLLSWENEVRNPGYQLGHKSLIPCSSCLSVFNSHISALNTFNAFSNTFFSLLSYIKRWVVENFPSEESSNMRFPLEHSSFVPPSYIFHKYSLSLITEWPWQALGSENIPGRGPVGICSWPQCRITLSNSLDKWEHFWRGDVHSIWQSGKLIVS